MTGTTFCEGLVGNPDEHLEKLKRFQARHHMKFLELDRVIFVILSGLNHNVVSCTKLTGNGCHLKIDCSLLRFGVSLVGARCLVGSLPRANGACCDFHLDMLLLN